MTNKDDRPLLLLASCGGLGILAVAVLLVRRRLRGLCPLERAAVAQKRWVGRDRYVMTPADKTKNPYHHHRLTVGQAIDDTASIKEFSEGLRASYPIFDSSSDLLLLRVESHRGDSTDQLCTKQKRYLNRDNGAAKNTDKVWAKLSLIFANLFRQHNYIDIN